MPSRATSRSACSRKAVTPTPTIAHVMDSIASGKFSVSMRLIALTTPASPMLKAR